MSRIFKDTKDKTDACEGPYVYLMCKSGGASDCIQGVWANEAGAQASADRHQQDAEDCWRSSHYWVEKHSIVEECEDAKDAEIERLQSVVDYAITRVGLIAEDALESVVHDKLEHLSGQLREALATQEPEATDAEPGVKP